MQRTDSHEPPDRRLEVVECIKQIGADVTEDVIDLLANRLAERCDRTCGCLSRGGSSVRDWVRLQLNDAKLLPKNVDDNFDMWHVVGVLHFWPWDEEKYGPKPAESCGAAVDTMRSPIYRLRDADPIDRTAWRVSKKSK